MWSVLSLVLIVHNQNLNPVTVRMYICIQKKFEFSLFRKLVPLEIAS